MLEERIKSILEGKLAELGYDLYQVKFKSGKNANLSIVVDRIQPISLEEIVSVSEKVSSWLDEANIIDEAYTLDVSSLGAEKPLKIEQLPSYIGHYVHLHLVHPVEGENILEGTLESIENEEVTLAIKVKTRVKHLRFPIADVDKARLAIEF